MKLWNRILDASIYYSFDLSGYLRHEKEFKKAELSFKPDSSALITGGTSGIGLATALFMADKGVRSIITGRNQDKGNNAAALNKNLVFKQLDLSNWSKSIELAQNIDPLEYILLNAGGMPQSFETNSKGIETQFASQLFAHYYLIRELKRLNKLKPNARIIWVTSGGMYLKNLDVTSITKDKNYKKVRTYANVKRAQVTLLNKFKDEFSDYTVTAMHPGWVETPGVQESIPGFASKMNGRLRTPLQGADTILWLFDNDNKAESGSLYFDRKKAKKHIFYFTKKSKNKINELWQLLQDRF